MTRRQALLQTLIGWVPVWGLIASLIAATHGTGVVAASAIALRMIFSAAILARGVSWLVRKIPWRTPVTIRFVAIHVFGAFIYSLSWIAANSLIESVFRGAVMIVVGVGLPSFIALGMWLYVMIAGVAYTLESTQRAAMAEATAARAQLSALRAQLNPHFLFNSLHTVVQLIPKHPQQASEAAEKVAGLLRTTLEEDRDVVSVAEEISFIERYLAIERIRFGERLEVVLDVPDPVRSASMPSFALQTLVENAVRHGATPKVDPTTITVSGRLDRDDLILTVADTGAGAVDGAFANTSGTGLRRLRERLAALYGSRASLDVGIYDGGGVHASMKIPQEPTD